MKLLKLLQAGFKGKSAEKDSESLMIRVRSSTGKWSMAEEFCESQADDGNDRRVQ